MKKFLTFTGWAKRHRYDFASESETKDQSSQPSKFIGRCPGEFLTPKSWLANKAATLKQLRQITRAANAQEMTTLKDLPHIQPEKMGRGLFIKNPQGLYNPRKFYLLLENCDYAFQNPHWMKYFPAFQSAQDAHLDMHFLLGTFYKMYLFNQKLQGSKTDDKPMSFVQGQLVLVKCKKEWIEKSDPGFAYEVRRGFIENESGTTSHRVYTVYLLDFGFTVEVTAMFLCPLPRPFDSIAPLAVQCSMYGISPIGAKWSYTSREEFSQLLGKHSDHVFVVDVLSDHRMPLFANIDICLFDAKIIRGQRKAKVKFQLNLTQFLIDSQRGVQWNLFPTRPKLMAGVTPSSPEPLFGPQKLPRVTVAYRDALLIAPVTLPVAHKRLPVVVISRELKKLFRLRHNYLVDVLGTTNYLASRIPDPDNIFRTPCFCDPTKCTDVDDDETVAILRMLK